MLVYVQKHSLRVTITGINVGLIKISNSIVPCDINILFSCVLYILNCYHMYSVLNISLAGFLSPKICLSEGTIHHFICLLGASSTAWGGGGLRLLWATQTSPPASSLCHSEVENA